jgi:AcrR family transcriptional regulator
VGRGAGQGEGTEVPLAGVVGDRARERATAAVIVAPTEEPMTSSETAPRTSRGARTRARLREAAREVFAERGYATTRVEDVVELAGVSHGTFYTYFENKAAILDALIDATSADLQAVVDEPWDGPDGAATIEAVIDRFVAVFAAHSDVMGVWLEASAHDPHFRQRLREVRRGYVQRVAEVLEPVLGPTSHDPSVAAAALVAMVEGYASEGLRGDASARRAEVVRTLSGLWLGGLIRLAEDG